MVQKQKEKKCTFFDLELFISNFITLLIYCFIVLLFCKFEFVFGL